MITASDKNVGISLLPPEWYAKEYQNQVIKGGHEPIEMTEESCIQYLISQIRSFRKQCSNDQQKILNNLWPKTTVTKHRIGVMKLVPKVHKLKGTLHKDSWKELTSRPIRGAETDPMREPSKVLYTLLQEMISTLKSRYENLSTFRLRFPVLNGCDDYIHRLNHVKLSTSKSMKTTF